VGAGALETSTLRRRLIAGEAPAVVSSQELPRLCKGPNGPVEGLKRRRAAEVAHANGAIEPKQSTPPSRQGVIQIPVPYLNLNDSAIGDYHARNASLVGSNAYSETWLNFCSKAAQNALIVSPDTTDAKPAPCRALVRADGAHRSEPCRPEQLLASVG
jgi:hypothetical protein